MHIFRTFISLSIISFFSIFHAMPSARATPEQSAAKQLYAVRGEVVEVKSHSKGMLSIRIKPPKDFAEVTLLARENDLVGNATSGGGRMDLLGLFSGDAHDDEMITAAELAEGDFVSAIYDPQSQNRVIEIYIH